MTRPISVITTIVVIGLLTLLFSLVAVLWLVRVMEPLLIAGAIFMVGYWIFGDGSSTEH